MRGLLSLFVIPDLIRNLVFTTLVTWVRLEILKPVVAGFSLRFLSQTRPKGTRLPGCKKKQNANRPSTYAKIQASADKPHYSLQRGKREEKRGCVKKQMKNR